jgi:endonuclease III
MKVVFASRELHMTSVTPPMFVTVTVGGELSSPFCGGYHPPMTAPGKARIREVQRRLRAEQGAFAPKPVLPVIDEVVATVLSQHTSDINSERAFAQLKERFSSWEQVAAAPAGQIADAIRCGGIADQKAGRIQQILAAIAEREGRIDLARLHDLDDTAARTYLESLPGVGPKTAACVLTFAMGRAAFPVDTHVHRVATRLGWLPAKTAADKAHRLLGPMVPADIRYDLHVAMISHGRTVCRAQRPRCGACVLNDLCAYGRQSAAAGQRQPSQRAGS